MLPLLLAISLVQQQVPADPNFPYWQQHVAYDITARLDEARGVLGGTEQVSYTNNSPDTLTSFSLHLHLNAFRPGSRWADADSVEGRRRFNDLKDPDYGYDRALPAAPAARARRQDGYQHGLGRAAFDRPEAAGPARTAFRFCPVVPQGRGL